jgi:hypothetical protein
MHSESASTLKKGAAEAETLDKRYYPLIFEVMGQQEDAARRARQAAEEASRRARQAQEAANAARRAAEQARKR